MTSPKSKKLYKVKKCLPSIKCSHSKRPQITKKSEQSVSKVSSSTKIGKPGKKKSSFVAKRNISRLYYIPCIQIPNSGKSNCSMPKQSLVSQSSGFSPKDRHYVLTNCQKRISRYKVLKAIAEKAITKKQIYSIMGNFKAIRLALNTRGWVEKLPANRMNLSKLRNGTYTTQVDIDEEIERLFLSSLVEKHPANFVFTMTRDDNLKAVLESKTPVICNRLNYDSPWTTKQGLCNAMRVNYWTYLEDVADVSSPRTYNSYEVGEVEDFISDYKLTACTSLLKWTLTMVFQEEVVFSKTGNVSGNILMFAINRCKEYLLTKQNHDLDKVIITASNGQWNTFLKHYYRMISRNGTFNVEQENKIKLYMSYATLVLKEMVKYRPQMLCEGWNNVWIIKPHQLSRGRGIRMASKLGVITNLLTSNNKYVIQKYIEEPLLIHDTKFDIRQYYLVTNTYPLTVWMYKDCYLKFSSQTYNVLNFHESIHLTNNAVQKKYQNTTNRHKELPENNMWDLARYQIYLESIDKDKVWDSIIYPGMKQNIIGVMLSCQNELSPSRGNFELYGCDFILDRQYKPWLIEINSSPDLNSTTSVTGKICPALLNDIIRVVIDHATDPTASTGKFECIYKQTLTSPRYSVNSGPTDTDLAIKGHALKLDYFCSGEEYLSDPGINTRLKPQRDINTMMSKVKQACLRKCLRQKSKTNEATQEHAVLQILKDDSFEEDTHRRLVGQESVLSRQINMLFKNIEVTVNSNKPPIQPLEEPPLFVPQLKQPKKLVEPSKEAIEPIPKIEVPKPASAAPIKSYDDLSLTLKRTLEIEAMPLATKTGTSGKCEISDITKIFQQVLYQLNDGNYQFNERQHPKKTASELNIGNATSRFFTFLEKKEQEYLGR